MTKEQFEIDQQPLIASIAADQATYAAQHGKHFYRVRSVVGGRVSEYEYVGPYGIGYIVILETTENGETYTKATDYGMENRSYDWAKQEVI